MLASFVRQSSRYHEDVPKQKMGFVHGFVCVFCNFRSNAESYKVGSAICVVLMLFSVDAGVYPCDFFAVDWIQRRRQKLPQ